MSGWEHFKHHIMTPFWGYQRVRLKPGNLINNLRYLPKIKQDI